MRFITHKKTHINRLWLGGVWTPTNYMGIKNYPFGRSNSLDLECEARKDASEEVKINTTSTMPVSLIIEWMGGKKEMKIQLEM